ncbi:RelA/SpoT domain-containing protein [Gallaecimonas pentaromativorans]|uniref:RelA/SpoT domain-containing protein n=1 Tax=Gallaecimonas pentaromativorans TaxID=584787 RepID=UPI000F4705D8|nr:RelA/SpoT domain-containing protein [Gallaecimonas pentaromativorans]
MDLSLEFFLENNRITREDWEKAAIEFDELKAIALDHAAKVTSLDDTASYLAKILQKCPQVHSVRWRVKDPVHLIEKIVRKRVLGSEKYLTINTKNYTEIITDLIGVRVLHLFKYEWVNIQEHILAHWKNEEAPVAYIRSGDEGEIVESYKANSCEVKNHPAGYRSIHYVISTQPTLNKVFSEIQVRTIFEEGWSEIDHKIRYPNFSNNELISYFLTIFNCMAGSADEMGSFVRNLTSEINIQELKIDEINRAQELHLSKIEELASELSNEKNKSKNKDSKVNKLSSEIQKLRANSQTRIYNESNLSATERLIAKATAIRAYSQNINSAAEKIASMNANILGGNSAAKIAAMNANILGGNSAAKLAAMNANILAGNSAAKIAEKVISKPSADEETGSDTEN